MEYLPSKTIITKAFAVLLITGGWFYFFGGKNESKTIATEPKDTSIVDGLVFVRKTNDMAATPSLQTMEKWKDLLNDEAVKSPATISGGIKSASVTAKTVQTTKFQEYTTSNLKIITDNSKTAFEKYGRDLARALKPYSAPNLPNEALLVLESIQNNDISGLQKVTIMEELHKIVVKNLLAVSVPEEIAWRHLNILNSAAKFAFIDSLLAQAPENSDAVKSNVADYGSESKNMILALSDLNSFFTDKGITFSNTDKISVYISL